MAHHTAPVSEAGERDIRVSAILHRAVNVIDAVNFGVTILKAQGPEQVLVIQRVKDQRVGFGVKRLITGAQCRRKFSVSKGKPDDQTSLSTMSISNRYWPQ